MSPTYTESPRCVRQTLPDSCHSHRPPQEFRKWLPRRRARQLPTFSWLARMSKYGSHGVRLATTYVGACQCVTEADVRDFFRRLTEARRGVSQPDPVDHTAGHEQAERELAAAGM